MFKVGCGLAFVCTDGSETELGFDTGVGTGVGEGTGCFVLSIGGVTWLVEACLGSGTGETGFAFGSTGSALGAFVADGSDGGGGGVDVDACPGFGSGVGLVACLSRCASLLATRAGLLGRE